MSLIPSAGDLEKAGDQLEQAAADRIVKQVVPAFRDALIQAANGLQVKVTITFDVTRKTT